MQQHYAHHFLVLGEADRHPAVTDSSQLELDVVASLPPRHDDVAVVAASGRVAVTSFRTATPVDGHWVEVGQN